MLVAAAAAVVAVVVVEAVLQAARSAFGLGAESILRVVFVADGAASPADLLKGVLNGLQYYGLSSNEETLRNASRGACLKGVA